MNEKLTLDMPICKPIEIKKHIKSNQQVLALDLGTKRIGVAISNGSSLIATPLTTINRKKFILDIEKLTDFATGSINTTYQRIVRKMNLNSYSILND